MPAVRISAKVIHWPPICACCGGPTKAAMEISHVRTKGVKVIRSEEKTWQVPYCTNCKKHLGAEETAESNRHQAEQAAHYWPTPRRKPPETDTVFVLAVIAVAGASVVFLLVPGVFMALRINPVMAGILACVIGGPFVGGIAWLCLKWYASEEPKREARKRRVEAEYQAAVAQAEQIQATARESYENMVRLHQSLLRPGCPRFGPAVVYDGWHGTVHTFQFTNPAFANAFAEANPGKIVEGQMG